MKKLLWICDQGIGNTLQTTPTLRALASIDFEVDVYLLERTAQLVQGFDAINQIITDKDIEAGLDKKWDLGILSIWSNEFIKKHYQWIKTHCQQTLRMEIGKWENPESEYHLQVAQKLGYEGEKPEPYIYYEKWDINIPKPYVVLGDTALPGWEKKRWKYYDKLAHELKRQGYNIVVVGGEYDKAIFRKDLFPDNIYEFFNQPLPKLSYLLKEAEFTVLNDSGLAHMSGIIGTKTFVIFGPTLEVKNRPMGDKVRVIDLDWHCRPCQYTNSWNICQETECLDKIYPEVILETIRQDTDFTAELATSKSKLICMMRIKDAIENHGEDIFRESLNSICRFVDGIVIVDNGSTDGTKEIYKEYDKILEIQDTQGFDEGRDKQLGLKMAKDHDADWIIMADADHVFEDRFTRARIEEMMEQKVGCYWFRTFQFWRNKKEYRVDQRWKPRYELAMFRNTPEAKFRDQKIHGSITDVKGNHKHTDLAVKHFGHLTEKSTEQKRNRYLKVDDSGRKYEHMIEKEGIEVAKWTEIVENRDLGKRSALIVMMHGAGDQMWLTPTIRQLKRVDPEMIIGLLVLPMYFNKEIWKNNPHIDHIFESRIDHHPTYWDAKRFNAEDRPIIDNDVAKIQEKFMFDNVTFITLQENRHLPRITRLANQFGISELSDTSMEIYTTEHDKEIAEHVLSNIGIQDDDFLVTVHRMAGNPPKIWDKEQAEKLVEQLTERNAKVLMLDLGDEKSITGKNIYSLSDCPEISIQITAEIIRKADLHIGTDSLPARLSAAVKTPFVNLFEVSWMNQSDDLVPYSTFVASQEAYQIADPNWLNEKGNRAVVSARKVLARDVWAGIRKLRQIIGEKYPKEFDKPIPDKDIPNKVYNPEDISYPVIQNTMNDILDLYRQVQGMKLEFNADHWFRHGSFFKFLDPMPKSRVLDIGTGHSIWGFYLALKRKYKVTVLDPETYMDLELQARNFQNIPLFVATGDIFDNDLQSEYFDYITCFSVLEHIENDTEAIKEIVKLLKPGGILAVTVDFYNTHIDYPDANRKLVIDRQEGHCDSRVYDKDSIMERLIEPVREMGMELIGNTDFENIDLTDRNNLAVRGFFTFARFFVRKDVKK